MSREPFGRSLGISLTTTCIMYVTQSPEAYGRKARKSFTLGEFLNWTSNPLSRSPSCYVPQIAWVPMKLTAFPTVQGNLLAGFPDFSMTVN